ncbi:MAG: DUF6788 family protein [Acidimicrobiales bacterium]
MDGRSRHMVNRRDESRIERARHELVALLGAGGHLLPGGVVERMMRCGKQNCRCSEGPSQLHGPYHQWNYTKRSRRYTRRLSDAQLERYGPDIDRGRRFMELLAELDDAEISRVERAEGWGA